MSTAVAEVRTFMNPNHEGYSISYCSGNGQLCGEQVASNWCRSQGYEHASSWALTPGVDVSSVTIGLDDESICRGAQCDGFRSISCEREGRTFRMPRLGGLERATLITPNRRGTEAAIEEIEYRVLIPGCHQREPGMFLCETVHEYQHCRTLLKAGRVFGCRAGLAFDGAFADPIAPSPDRYKLSVKSNAAVTVRQGQRGEGKVKGAASFDIRFDLPDINEHDWCLQRDRYIYHPTGPKGGLADIDDIQSCDEEISGSFEPHEDDIIQAYDLCQASVSWGTHVDQPIELMVAALFHIGSARPDFSTSPVDGSSKILAHYLTVQAPMRVECKH